MKIQCHGCTNIKDTQVKEFYPYPEDSIIQDTEISPFFVLECEDWTPDKLYGWKAAIVCHECFHLLQPDMWISSSCWEKINPRIPFFYLPTFKEDDRFDAESYPEEEITE